MNLVIIFALSSVAAFGVSYVIGQAIASPLLSRTVVVAVGLTVGNVMGIVHAKGWL